MSFTVTDAFVQQFTGNVAFLAQQSMSRLRGKTLEDQITGESGFMEQIAPSAARKRQSRHGDSPIMNTQHLRRRVTHFGYEWGDLVDRLDKVALLIDPTSAYAQTGAMAMARAQDDEIIGGMFAVAYTGHAGATTVTWPNGNAESTPTTPAGTQVAVNNWDYGSGSGNSGLTISKLISAGVALDAAEGDENEERFILLNARAKGQLLATTEATSADYAAVKALVDGKIDKFMGFTFLHSERILLNGSSQYRIPAWRKSGLALGVGEDIDGRIAERSDKSFAMYVFCDESIGATRMEESKLVELICT